MNSFEKSQAQKILSMYNNFENDIEKAKAFPIGSLDKSGKNIKTVNGWVSVKKHKQQAGTEINNESKKDILKEKPFLDMISRDGFSYEELSSKTVFYKEDGSWLTAINNDSPDLDSAKKLTDKNKNKKSSVAPDMSEDIYSDLTPEQKEKVKEAKPSEKIGTAKVVITFANQKLLNLWKNEMQGQISDGMWENSRNTEWLWKDVAVRLGDETKVEVSDRYAHIGKTSFPFGKDLKEIVGERATEEAGFKDLSETSKAWKEINDAIKNVKYSEKLGIDKQKLVKEQRNIYIKNVENVKERLKKRGFDNQYSFSSSKKLSSGIKVTVNPESVTSVNGKGSVDIEVNSYQRGIPIVKTKIGLDNLDEFIKTTEDYLNILINFGK